MTRDDLVAALQSVEPAADNIVYIERRGTDYAWRLTLADAAFAPPIEATSPDVWLYYSGPWPPPDQTAEDWRAFFDDLLDEMESMAAGRDRCRWPLDKPWPHRH